MSVDLARELLPGTFEHAVHHPLATIAHFVSTLGEDIAHVFAAVVAICDQQGLISREMFAIDGVKLPSNASKQRSGFTAALGSRGCTPRLQRKLHLLGGHLVPCVVEVHG